MTSKSIKSKNNLDLISYSKSRIEGTYLNIIEGHDYKDFGLWNMLARSYDNNLDTVSTTNEMTVRLQFTDSDILNVSLLKNNTVLKEFELKGKVDEEYFSIKRKYLLVPIPFLTIYSDTKNMLAITVNGNLNLLHANKHILWLIMAGGGGGIGSYEFQKINN